MEAPLKKYVWHLKSYKGDSATVIFYPWLMAWEASTRSDRLFKRLYRHLPAKPRNYESFKKKMAAVVLYAQLGLRISHFQVVD